jgi:hypothetical protein
MLKVNKDFFATDENGNEVLVCRGDSISEISDAGPVERFDRVYDVMELMGWNVSFRFMPQHKQWSELVTYDAVKLLKALEG